MAIYLLYVASPFLVYLLASAVRPQSLREQGVDKKDYLIVCGVIMTLMIGLRSKSVGSTDSAFYYQYWQVMAKVPLSKLTQYMDHYDLERGFQICVWMLTCIFKDGQWAFVLSGAFYALSVCRFVYKNSDQPMLSMLAFHCLGCFNFMVQGMRQALAMCICLWAVEYIKRGKLWKFALVVALACTFHGSAVVFVAVYFIRNMKINWKSLMVFAVLIVVGIVSLPYIVSLVNAIIQDDYEIGQGADSGGVFAILIYVSVLAFGLIWRDKEKPEYALFYYMTFLGLAAMLMRNTINTIAERVNYYFAFGQMIVLSNSVAALKKNDERVIMTIVVALLCFGVAIHKASYSVLIPYTFFWQG